MSTKIRLDNQTINAENFSIHFDIEKTLLKSNEIKVSGDTIEIVHDFNGTIYKGNWETLFELIGRNKVDANNRLINANERIYIVHTYSGHRFTCNLKDIPAIDVKDNVTKIKEIWNDKVLSVSKKAINEMFVANQIDYEF